MSFTIDDLNPTAAEHAGHLHREVSRLAAHHRHLHAQGQVRHAPEGIVPAGVPQETDQETER